MSLHLCRRFSTAFRWALWGRGSTAVANHSEDWRPHWTNYESYAGRTCRRDTIFGCLLL